MIATDSSYLSARRRAPRDVAGLVAMGCRLDDSVQVRSTPPANYETSWVPPERLADFMKGQVAFTDLTRRNDAVPASHVGPFLPPTLMLIAEGERFYPPILRDAAEFVGRALAAGATADLAILPGRTHMTAIGRVTTPQDSTVAVIAAFVRGH
jgi:acetyl esterase/lipase